MDALNFVYWLQGIFEIGEVTELTPKQVEIIKQHIALVLHHVEHPISGTRRLGGGLVERVAMEPAPEEGAPSAHHVLQELGARPPWGPRIPPHLRPFDPHQRIC